MDDICVWIDVNDKLPNDACILNVRRKNGEELKVYFYPDKMAWLAFYGKKLSYWYKYNTNDPVMDVTHWLSKK